jgi:putative ABC transport system permease protein
MRLDVQQGDLATLATGGAVIRSDFAQAHDLAIGDAFTVTTQADRPVRLVVGAVMRNPRTDLVGLGAVFVGTDRFTQSFATRGAALTLIDTDGPAAALERAIAAFPEAEVAESGAWIEDNAAWIDQILSVFYVLLALAVVVSLFGIVNTLALAVVERTRELGMLRAIGMTRRQTRRMIRHESVVTALLGAVTGIAAGLGLAGIAVAALAKWGFAYAIPTGTLVAVLVVAVLAGLLAAAIPARRAARMDPLGALATT